MRRGRDNGLLLDSNKKLVGINLGADFTSEHEWGIKGLRALFGIADEGLGIVKRTMTKMPSAKSYMDRKVKSCIHLIEKTNETFLIVSEYFDADKFEPQRYELSRYKNDELATAWDEKSFGISAAKPEEREAIREVYAAMQKNDLAIWIGGGGVFQNGGLVLAIVSRIPKESIKVMHDADVDKIKLFNAASDTGIAKRLEAAGKRYYALSPKWANEIKSTAKGEIKTKYPVIFWLNPTEQDIYNFGWFTVEDLDQWAKNQGPCMGGRNAERSR